MTQETRQRGRMDLNTFNWKKVFSIALQIACSAAFLFYFLGEAILYILSLMFGGYTIENTADPFIKLKKYLYLFLLYSYPCIFIANIIFLLSCIASLFLKYSRWLRIIVKYALKFSTIFTSIAGLGLVCLLISDVLLAEEFSSTFNDGSSYLLLFIILFYPILIFLRPCYFRYFVFYRTPIVRQRRLLWLNMVPLSIFLILIVFFSARISDAIK